MTYGHVSYLSWKSEKIEMKLFLGILYYIKLIIILQLFKQRGTNIEKNIDLTVVLNDKHVYG